MTAPVLEVERLSVDYAGGRRRPAFRAVHDVSFAIDRGRTLGLVGESGSGKSTTGLAVLRLVEPAEGTVRFEGRDLRALDRRELRRLRPSMSMVFQDPFSSLDPSMTVGQIVAEPLAVQRIGRRSEREERVVTCLRKVGLDADHRSRYPHEFSGGQRQRIAIARSLISEPSLIVCDEAVSALDVSTRSQIINLLEDLQDSLDVTLLFIAHDLLLVRHISDEIAVMYLGRILETGPATRVYEAPAHPYTAALLSSVLSPDPEEQRPRVAVATEPVAPAGAVRGCPFNPRCPFVMDVCRTEMPPTVAVAQGGSVACHLHTGTGPAGPAAELGAVAVDVGPPKERELR